ncbi:hypothetical protein D3C72_2444660 [compost metagenome]
MTFDVLVGDFQRLEGQVGEHHLSLGEYFGTDDTDATGAGAQVEDACRLTGQPWLEALFDQLANR